MRTQFLNGKVMRTFFICAMWLCGSLAFCQPNESETLPLTEDDYTPLVVDSKRWKGVEVNPMDGQRYGCDYLIDGDTVIGGEQFKKCYAVRARYGTDAWYECALQEQDRKVYVVGRGQEEKFLLFDFNLKEGESFGLMDTEVEYIAEEGRGLPMRLAKIDYVVGSGGKSLRRYAFHILDDEHPFENDHNTLLWIEGVGKSGNPFAWSIDRVGGYGYMLNGCYIEDGLLYPEQELSGIDSVDETGFIYGQSAMSRTPLYDLQGRRLTGKSARGLYIEQGRKCIVR